ncbi:DUF3322 domain-containing protein [Micromonospora sp. CPCC 205739]|uniref:DUF3322 domain-containing protein n=1 Tax=unclassified Micromonospora TaxID=2617518 RepID=UPI003FA5425C
MGAGAGGRRRAGRLAAANPATACWRTRRTQQLPVAGIVQTSQGGLRLLGRRHAADAARFADALARADLLGPPARGLALDRPNDVLAAVTDWPLLLELAAWIRRHPRPGIYPRQIPVAGGCTRRSSNATPACLAAHS